MAKESTKAKTTETKKPATTTRKRAPKKEAEAPVQAQVRENKPLPKYLETRRTEVGRVVSDKMEKTVVVLVERKKPHPLYKKIMRRSVKLRAHDEANSANVGDTVRVVECRPLSRTKRWRLVEILEVAR